MTLAWAAYRVAAPVLGAIAPAARLLASPQERPLWNERMGIVHSDHGCEAWVHGASLGEAGAVLPLVHELGRLDPQASFWLTATTRAGRARLATSGHPATLAPIDAPQAVDRFFRGLSPRRLWIVETELWPHWLLGARARAVPVAILSARLSERSLGHYRTLGSDLRDLVRGLAGVLCQSDADARRWVALGSNPERTDVVGNLKIDALPEPAPSRPIARLALELDPERPLLVLGSVRPGELRLIARAWMQLPEALRAPWQVAIVPRHTRATRELREELASNGGASAARAAATAGWHWDDRPGVLNSYYAAADVAFVGGSLLAYGGHNPLEPAACGAAVVMGPHHRSQLPAVQALAAENGIAIASGDRELAAAFEVLLGDAAARARQAVAADRALAGLRGASRRAVARLAGWGLWPVA